MRGAAKMNGHANGSGQGVVKPRKPETSRLFLVPVGLILGLLWVKACAALMLHLPPSSFGEGSPDTHLRGPRHLDGPPADVVQLQLWTQAGKLGYSAATATCVPLLSASSFRLRYQPMSFTQDSADIQRSRVI